MAGFCSRTPVADFISDRLTPPDAEEDGSRSGGPPSELELATFHMVKHFAQLVGLFLTYSSSSFNQLAAPLTCVVLASQSTSFRGDYNSHLWLNGVAFDPAKHWHPEPSCAHPHCTLKPCSIQYKCWGCDGIAFQPKWFDPNGCVHSRPSVRPLHPAYLLAFALPDPPTPPCTCRRALRCAKRRSCCIACSVSFMDPRHCRLQSRSSLRSAAKIARDFALSIKSSL